MMKPGISIIMLAYHEEENLKRVIPEIIESINDLEYEYEIIVVDTAVPTDDTQSVCEKYGARYINQKSPGFGGALISGIDSVNYDRVLTLDSDGAHPPCVIPQIVKMHDTGRYDIVIGSRYVRGGGTNDPITNILMSRLLNFTYALAFGLKAKDLSTNFRLYYTDDLKGLQLECINYDVLQEVLIRIKEKKGKLSIGETPIVLRKRMEGKSKRKLCEFIRSYIYTLFRLKRIVH